MPTFMLTHRHDAGHCRTAFVAWQGFDSPLRRHPTPSSCVDGGHAIWWRVDAADEAAALAQLPEWIAARTDVTRVRDVLIP